MIKIPKDLDMQHWRVLAETRRYREEVRSALGATHKRLLVACSQTADPEIRAVHGAWQQLQRLYDELKE